MSKINKSMNNLGTNGKSLKNSVFHGGYLIYLDLKSDRCSKNHRELQ